MDHQFWQFSTSSNTLDSMQKAPFTTNVSSYFRRPSKVVKPSSRNNSPRNNSRRRMTTTGHVPVRTRSVVDHQRMSMPQLSDTRPVSWHPNTIEDLNQYQMMNQGMYEGVMNTPYMSSDVNGLVTPMSFPLMDEPQIQDLITPLEGLSANEAGSGYGYGQDFDMTQYWLTQQAAKESVIDIDPSLYSMMDYQPWFNTIDQYTMPHVPTIAGSPSFLPMPEFGAPLEVEIPAQEDASEELVAMGLYDSPAQVQSSSLLFGTMDGTTRRKSLKLEDSFEPSSNEDDDAEDDDEGDAVASEEDDDQPGVSPTTINPLPQLAMDAAASAQMMNNGYITNQWHVPVQNGYGWI